MWTNQIPERVEEERECGFEIDTVGRQDDVWVMVGGCRAVGAPLQNFNRRWSTPVVDARVDFALELVQGDVLLHQRQHGDLVGDAQFPVPVLGQAKLAAQRDGQSHEATACANLDDGLVLEAGFVVLEHVLG